jgi:hypothetical protein
MNLQLENKTAADFFHHAAGSLLRRFATPDEVAAMVAHVARPLASATSASMLSKEASHESHRANPNETSRRFSRFRELSRF